MYSAYLLLLSLAVGINSILIGVLYRSNQKNSTIASLIILLVQVNVWFTPKILTNALHANSILFETLSRISSLGYIFVPVTFLVFALSYSMYHKVFRVFSFWVLLLLPPLFFLYLSWTSNLVGVHDAQRALLYSWGYETPTGKLWPYYMFWYDSVMFAALCVLGYNYHRLVDHYRKRQTLYIILVVIAPLVVATITTGILPLFNIFVFPVGLILTCAMTIIGVSAIYQYGWFMVTPLTILSSINHVIITVDNKGNVIQMNPYSEKMLQVKTSQVIGRPLEKILFVKDKKKKNTNVFSNLLQPVVTRGKSIMLDTYSILNRNNNLFATKGSITPIFSDKSGVVGANIFLRDATKETEKLRQKDDYFSMLSHELKTPITSIKAYSELLLARLAESPNNNRDLVMKINNNLDGLTRRIDDFLELSRLTSGKFKLDREIIEVDDFVKGIVDTMKITYKKRKIYLTGSTRSIVFADKVRIEQVIINFITNALKFSPKDKEIIVALAVNPAYITVTVKDFGIGINPKFQKRIFDRFFQIDTSSNGGGIGMGLFIASSIVKSHNGKIWVESGIGKGSSFSFSLPTTT